MGTVEMEGPVEVIRDVLEYIYTSEITWKRNSDAKEIKEFCENAGIKKWKPVAPSCIPQNLWQDLQGARCKGSPDGIRPNIEKITYQFVRNILLIEASEIYGVMLNKDSVSELSQHCENEIRNDSSLLFDSAFHDLLRLVFDTTFMGTSTLRDTMIEICARNHDIINQNTDIKSLIAQEEPLAYKWAVKGMILANTYPEPQGYKSGCSPETRGDDQPAARLRRLAMSSEEDDWDY